MLTGGTTARRDRRAAQAAGKAVAELVRQRRAESPPAEPTSTMRPKHAPPPLTDPQADAIIGRLRDGLEADAATLLRARRRTARATQGTP